MTAKEKANDLAMKFIMETNSTDNRFGIDKELALQCATLAVDEMIKQLPFTDLNTYIGKWCESQREFLHEVKEELLKSEVWKNVNTLNG
jgi:hypothetical protein